MYVCTQRSSLDGIYTYINAEEEEEVRRKRQKKLSAASEAGRGEYFDIGSTMSAEARFSISTFHIHTLLYTEPDAYRKLNLLSG